MSRGPRLDGFDVRALGNALEAVQRRFFPGPAVGGGPKPHFDVTGLIVRRARGPRSIKSQDCQDPGAQIATTINLNFTISGG
jgi:hypothetical protein